MITNNREKMPIDDNTMLLNPSCNMNAKNKILKVAPAKKTIAQLVFIDGDFALQSFLAYL
jgi:hypothetical protein